MDEKYLLKAIKIAEDNVKQNGGPFGAVITKDGLLLSSAGNQVIESNDPTAHAEINVIREASRKLQTYDLGGCTIYCSCEPCPMCLAAIYWARIDRIVFASGRDDAKKAGFDDVWIYDELLKPAHGRVVAAQRMLNNRGKMVFRLWNEMENRIRY
ncbi:MAG: nucleoside deaminase [Bacteroidales bacterium]|nr:MAG: nucleoside deaminase [Bacteroidales bacterium]